MHFSIKLWSSNGPIVIFIENEHVHGAREAIQNYSIKIIRLNGDGWKNEIHLEAINIRFPD